MSVSSLVKTMRVNTRTHKDSTSRGSTAHGYAKCAMNDMVSIYKDRTEWQPETEWKLTTASKLFNKISLNNNKFTTPVQNWAVAICVSRMFEATYPKNMRNNIIFKRYYQDAVYDICNSIAAIEFDCDPIKDSMEK